MNADRLDPTERTLTRRAFSKRLLGQGAGVLAWLHRPLSAQGTGGKPGPLFDQAMQGFMKDRGIPGAALAVLRGAELVYARAYGWADRHSMVPAETNSRFRIASLSKPITALALLQYVEKKQVDLDQPVADLLHLATFLPANATWDARWKIVTIRQLLHHTGGWDREASFDPMFRARKIAAHFQLDRPPNPWEVIRYMLEQPLDFDPGQRYAYSNFGYCLLGRVLEKVSGKSYEECVRHSLLQPLGIQGMKLGKTEPLDPPPAESRYYTAQDERTRSVHPLHTDSVLWPYGGFWLEAMDAHGGWTASVLDLARITAAFLDTKRPLLRPETFQLLLAPPPPPASRNAEGVLDEVYYGCGWSIRRQGAQNKPNLWHTGSLPGTYALWVQRGDGLSYVALFNQRSDHALPPDTDLDRLLYRAADAVTDWGGKS